MNCDFDHYPKDNIAIINNFTFSFDEMEVTIDPNFLNRIINFITNISYRTNIIFYDIDDIFIPKSTLIQNNFKLNRTLQQASLNSFLIYASKINLPQIKIDLQISKIGLSSLLKKKFNCSSFTCKIVEQIAGHTIKINIDKLSLRSFQGGYNDSAVM